MKRRPGKDSVTRRARKRGRTRITRPNSKDRKTKAVRRAKSGIRRFTDPDIRLAQKIIDTLNSLIYVLDAGGRFVLVNRKAESVLGVPRENVIGNTRDAFLPEEVAATHRSNDLAVMRAGLPITFEEENQEPDGKHTYLTVKTPLIGDDGTAYAVCGISTDITERKSAENQVKRLNRIYAVLSNINHAIVHIHDVRLMLQEGCRIAVDDGLFAMALAGMVNPDTRRVEPIALKGTPAGSPPTAGIDLDEFQQSSGLTGTAILTGNYALSNDIEHDEIMLPWRAHLLRLGFRSSASVPLKVSGETRGAFTLYARETGFFTEDEMRLLVQLAGDISFGIDFNEEESKRKRAQEALSNSEQKLNQLFEEAPVGYHEIDAQGDIVRINRTELEMLGYSSEEMLHHPVWEFIVESEISRKAIAAKLDGTFWPESVYERSFRKKDGTALHVLIKDRALRNESGKILGIRATVQDIEERKKADRELRLLGQTIASLHDCISITDLENRFLFVNDAFRVTYGYTPDDLLGKEVSILRSPLAPPAMADRILQDTLAGGWHGELLNRRKDGSDIPVELWTSVVRDEAGNPVGLVGVGRDITVRRIEEEDLRQSEERFRLIAENVADLIAVLDLEGRRVYNSPSYKSILADPESLKGTDAFQNIHPKDVDRVKQVFRETVRTGVGQRIQYRLLGTDGSVRTIDSKGSVIRDKDGNVFRVVVVSRDVTEEKTMAEQLLRAQRMESIGTLAGGIAHDLNNVLAPILMAIQILRDKVPGPRGQHLLDTIQLSAMRGSGIVKQVLAYGRGFNGDRILLQIKHVINEVVKIAGETFPRSIEFRTYIPEGLWTVSADPTQMHQVLLNILLNARDSMHEGGTLTLSAENVTLDENFSRLHLEATPGAYVSIAITDTGMGIPDDIRERIFEPFFTTKEIGEGTGLGLSTSLAIVRSHGGFINLYTEDGKGTTFRIYIPATGTASGGEETNEEENFPVGNGELILVIDDEAAIREITRETLLAFGYKVITAGNGAEGVALFAENAKTIKAVITDIMMPVMDGTAAILALQEMDPDIKVIAASGLATKGQVAPPSNDKVRAFLTKPYTAEKLLRTLADVLS